MDGSFWPQKTFDRTFQELSNGVYLNGCNVKSHPQNNLKRLPFTPRSSVNWGYSFCFSVGIHAAAIGRSRTARRAVATAGGDVSQEECRAQKRKVKQNKKFILHKSIALKMLYKTATFNQIWLFRVPIDTSSNVLSNMFWVQLDTVKWRQTVCCGISTH